MIDTHAHYNSKDLRFLKEEIVNLQSKKEFSHIINVGTNLEISREVINLSAKYDFLYSSIGIHPLKNGNPIDIYKLYNECSDNSKIVAIGEIGMDIGGDLYNQRKKFIELVNIANYFSLPVIVHSNGTNEELINLIRCHPILNGFVFHCFQPDIEVMHDILNIGGYISVTNPILRPNAKKVIK